MLLIVCVYLECHIDLVFLWDRSGSICDFNPTFNKDRPEEGCDNWDTMRAFILQYVRGIPVSLQQNRVAMITFGTDAKIEWYLSE